MVRGQRTTEETLLVTLLLREWDRISEFMCCFFREPCWVCYSGTLTSPLCGFHTDTSIHTDTRTHTHEVLLSPRKATPGVTQHSVLK